MGARARASAENPRLLCQLAPLTLSPEPDLPSLRTSQPFIHTKPLMVPISLVCHILVKNQLISCRNGSLIGLIVFEKKRNDKVAPDECVHAALSRGELFSSTSGGGASRNRIWHRNHQPQPSIITILSCKCIFSSHKDRKTSPDT